DPALCRIPLAVEPTVVATVDLFRQGTTTHPIAIAWEPALPKTDADPDAIERVLTNLISNAIKYSPAGSVVRVGPRARNGGAGTDVADPGGGIAGGRGGGTYGAVLSGSGRSRRGARHGHRPGGGESAGRGAWRRHRGRECAHPRNTRDRGSPRVAWSL